MKVVANRESYAHYARLRITELSEEIKIQGVVTDGKVPPSHLLVGVMTHPRVELGTCYAQFEDVSL
jgi:hypothetical protein